MIKRAMNLPFVVLGKLARSVQERERAKQAAVDARRPRVEEAAPGADQHPRLRRPRRLRRGRCGGQGAGRGQLDGAGRTVHFVDVRARRTLCIPGSQHLPLQQLGIELAELPPAGHPLVVYCEDGAASARAVVFLRFRGIEDASSSRGPVGLAEREAVEPAPEAR